jgi:hypothetical protein
MTLTLEIAKALVKWHEGMHYKSIQLDGKAVHLRLLNLREPLVWRYLSQRLPSKSLVLTDSGWGITNAALAGPLAEAEALLASLPPSAALTDEGECGGLKKSLDEPSAPSSPATVVIPQDGVEWHLCDASLVAERVDEGRASPERKRTLQQLAEQPVRWLPKVTQARSRAAIPTSSRRSAFWSSTCCCSSWAKPRCTCRRCCSWAHRASVKQCLRGAWRKCCRRTCGCSPWPTSAPAGS